MLIHLLDVARIVLVGIGFYVGYSVGFSAGYDPAEQLHVMVPFVVVAVAGISGIEGLIWGRQAALAKGFETGSSYQRQSSFAQLSYAVTAMVVYFVQWGLEAELTLLLVFLIFFTLSAVNHTVEAVIHRNFRWQNINRPFILTLLIAGFIYPVVKALKML